MNELNGDVFNEWVASVSKRPRKPYQDLFINFGFDTEFWDTKYGRALPLEQAVEEGYFKSVRSAKAYYNALLKDYDDDDDDDDDNDN